MTERFHHDKSISEMTTEPRPHTVYPACGFQHTAYLNSIIKSSKPLYPKCYESVLGKPSYVKSYPRRRSGSCEFNRYFTKVEKTESLLSNSVDKSQESSKNGSQKLTKDQYTSCLNVCVEKEVSCDIIKPTQRDVNDVAIDSKLKSNSKDISIGSTKKDVHFSMDTTKLKNKFERGDNIGCLRNMLPKRKNLTTSQTFNATPTEYHQRSIDPSSDQYNIFSDNKQPNLLKQLIVCQNVKNVQAIPITLNETKHVQHTKDVQASHFVKETLADVTTSYKECKADRLNEEILFNAPLPDIPSEAKNNDEVKNVPYKNISKLNISMSNKNIQIDEKKKTFRNVTVSVNTLAKINLPKMESKPTKANSWPRNENDLSTEGIKPTKCTKPIALNSKCVQFNQDTNQFFYTVHTQAVNTDKVILEKANYTENKPEIHKVGTVDVGVEVNTWDYRKFKNTRRLKKKTQFEKIMLASESSTTSDKLSKIVEVGDSTTSRVEQSSFSNIALSNVTNSNFQGDSFQFHRDPAIYHVCKFGGKPSATVMEKVVEPMRVRDQWRENNHPFYLQLPIARPPCHYCQCQHSADRHPTHYQPDTTRGKITEIPFGEYELYDERKVQRYQQHDKYVLLKVDHLGKRRLRCN